MTVRSTYALDVDTVSRIEDLARRWSVSKSEALRRAVRDAAARHAVHEPSPGQALDALQRSLRLSPSAAGSWVRAVRQERRAAIPERGK